MIKKCRVIARNAINMVVVYDGMEIQMPTDNTDNHEIYINKVGNKFLLSSESEMNKNPKKKTKKVSEVELAVEDIKASDDE